MENDTMECVGFKTVTEYALVPVEQPAKWCPGTACLCLAVGVAPSVAFSVVTVSMPPRGHQSERSFWGEDNVNFTTHSHTHTHPVSVLASVLYIYLY